MRLQTGDIVKFVGTRITAIDKRSVLGFKSNQTLRTTVFGISGVNGAQPFANGLVKKNFVVYIEKRAKGYPAFSYYTQRVRLFMIEDYKPKTLGKGYVIRLNSLDYVKKTGRVIDVRDLPRQIRNLFYSQRVLTEGIKYTLNKTSKTSKEKIKLLRKNYPMFTGIPKHIQWALYTGKSHRCGQCSAALVYLGMRLYDLDTATNKKEIAEYISNNLIKFWGAKEEDTINVLPIAYRCPECLHDSILVDMVQTAPSPNALFMSSSQKNDRKPCIVNLPCDFINDSKLIYPL